MGARGHFPLFLLQRPQIAARLLKRHRCQVEGKNFFFFNSCWILGCGLGVSIHTLAPGPVYVRTAWRKGFPEIELFEVDFASMRVLCVQATAGSQWHAAESEGSRGKRQQIGPSVKTLECRGTGIPVIGCGKSLKS